MRFSLQTLILATVILCVAAAGFGGWGFSIALVLLALDFFLRPTDSRSRWGAGNAFELGILAASLLALSAAAIQVGRRPLPSPAEQERSEIRIDRRGRVPSQPRAVMVTPVERFFAWSILFAAFLGYFALRRKEAARRSGGPTADQGGTRRTGN